MIRQIAVLALLASVSFIGVAEARDQIRIVGSSTVFPFSTRVGEEFGRTTNFKSPVVESTGTGGRGDRERAAQETASVRMSRSTVNFTSCTASLGVMTGVAGPGERRHAGLSIGGPRGGCQVGSE